MRRRLRSVSGAVPLGLALIVVGVLLTLDNLAVLDAAELLAGWWPVAVMVAGVWWLLTGSPLTGLIVTVIGLLLLATTQDVVEADVGSLIFPVLLVIVGGGLLQAGWRVRTARITVGTASSVGAGRAGAKASDAVGESQRSATAVFGDARIAVYDDGADHRRVLVTATSVFGDVKIEVPPGWRVIDRVGRVFGDVSVPRDQPDDTEAPVVEVYGLVVFGDVTVRASDRMKGPR